MSWTDERVALLKKLWIEGKTAAEIANALGDVTRNAVIGKAHRLKLSNRVSPIQQNKKPVPVINKQQQPLERKIVRVVVDENRKRIAMLDLKPRECRWPFGDPQEENFGFCGCNIVAGLPYCDEHAKAAYQVAGRNRVLKAKDFEEQEEKAATTAAASQ